MARRSAPKSASGLSPEQEQTWFAYMRVALRLNYEINCDLHASSSLSHADFHVLNALADSPGRHLLVGDLAVRIGWERSRMSHQLLRMEKRGLVSRQTSATDARATDVRLTDQGWHELRGATPRHANLVKELFFDGLDPQLLAPLHAALDQIHETVVRKGSLPPPPGHQTHWVD